jgi:hypothetical protein
MPRKACVRESTRAAGYRFHPCDASGSTACRRIFLNRSWTCAQASAHNWPATVAFAYPRAIAAAILAGTAGCQLAGLPELYGCDHSRRALIPATPAMPSEVDFDANIHSRQWLANGKDQVPRRGGEQTQSDACLGCFEAPRGHHRPKMPGGIGKR